MNKKTLLFILCGLVMFGLTGCGDNGNLSDSEIKNIVIYDMGVNLKEVKFDSIDYENDENSYEIEVKYAGIEYEYHISNDGKVLSSTYPKKENKTDSNNETIVIGLSKAKQIALDYVKASEEEIKNFIILKDYENGQEIYEVEFDFNNIEYDIDIDVITGKVIKIEKDNIDD